MNMDYQNYFPGIAGYEAVKRDAFEMIDMINNEAKYVKYGARKSKGYLLYGDPGMGKTRFARAILAAVKCPVFEISEEASVREKKDMRTLIVDMFAEAGRGSNALVFIDEIDKLVGYDKDEYGVEDNLVLQKTLLQAIDEAEGRGIVIVATANALRFLQKSLLRSGRVDRMTEVRRPTIGDCRALFDEYTKQVGLSADFDRQGVISGFLGCSCADIECIVNEAIIHSVSRGDGIVRETDIAYAYSRVNLKDISQGQEDLDVEERKAIACHEAGHAFAALYYGKSIISVSIKRQGASEGRVFERGVFSPSTTAEDAEKDIRIALAGNVASEVIFGKRFFGGASDLSKAAACVITMCENGMFGYKYCSFREYSQLRSSSMLEWDHDFYVNRTRKITETLETQDRIVREVISAHRDVVEKIADRLLERWELGASELKEIYDSAMEKIKSRHESCNETNYTMNDND